MSNDMINKLKRAGHTVWQTAAAVAATAAIAAIGSAQTVTEVDWRFVAGSAALAGLVSLLKSIAIGTPEDQTEDATIASDDRGY